jgi:hypothetical protein
MDEWEYVERQVVRDPKGREWCVALMDVLGQVGDPDVPDRLLEIQYAAGRYFTLIYSPSGGVQWERGHPSLETASAEYSKLLAEVVDGRLDPAQPPFRATLDEE